ncbi:MAG: hypothetical protein HYT79_10710 [Elusimicrobia bacterium]|nr:hypothetical protein [Elusimicrobiota bacterium]
MSRWKKIAISVFVVAWTLVFHYESTRAFVLNRIFNKELPKLKLLFPPAGWIMFYQVDDNYGTAEVYGIKGQIAFFIDPHRIFETRWLGYDNIHRNMMVSVLNAQRGPDFCRYLKRKFPEYDGFAVMRAIWPALSKTPDLKQMGPLYQCDKEGRAFLPRQG